MFTKLNRVLLASGLAIASAAMLSPAVFAQIITNGTSDASKVGALDGEILTVLTLTWVGSGTPSFTIPATGIISAQSLGTLTALGNVAYKITGVSAQNGVLKGDDGVQEIPYTLSFDSGSSIVTNTGEFVLSLVAANTPVTDRTLTLSNTNTVPNLKPQHYKDTLTLTTKSQL
jgi:hypothetical protein